MARTAKKSRLDLHEALLRPSFATAVICTYTFDPLFFEDYCLEKFAALSNNNNISVLTDRLTYEKVISAPESQRPRQVNLRYLLHPITVKRRFHSKLFFFTTKTTGRLILGSANFTRAGLTANAEIVDVFDFELDEAEEFLPLFQDAFAYLTALAQRWPSESLTSNLNELHRSTPWLHADQPPSEGSTRFIHNLDRPLWDQISDTVDSSIDALHVVSRFFDDEPHLISRVTQHWNPKKLVLYTQNGVTTMTPKWLAHPSVGAGSTEILMCTYEDDGHQQPLHAKAIVFDYGSRRTLVYGSANFTSAALLTSHGNGNIETMLVTLNIAARGLDPKHFCDPAESGHHLHSADELKSTPRGDEPFARERPIHLLEAILDEDRLSMHADVPADIALSSVVARLRLGNTRGQALTVTQASPRHLLCRVPERILPRLQETASLVGLEIASSSEPVSNLVFVTNLLDIKTQSSVRRDRHIREATQSASQFFAVLNDLLAAGDDRALLTFLNFCDIPLMSELRHSVFRQRPVWPGQEGMRALGERNLHICRTLHEATMSFVDRHFKKLKKHTQALSIAGLSNFLHIFLSMGALLRMQIERAVIALEEKPSVVSTEEWFECRNLWDIYFLKFRDLMACLWDEYLERMKSDYNRDELLAEAGQDFDAIHELSDSMIKIRDRIEQVRLTKCTQPQPGGKQKAYGYFYSVLNPASWRDYAAYVQSRQHSVDLAIQ